MASTKTTILQRDYESFTGFCLPADMNVSGVPPIVGQLRAPTTTMGRSLTKAGVVSR